MRPRPARPSKVGWLAPRPTASLARPIALGRSAPHNAASTADKVAARSTGAVLVKAMLHPKPTRGLKRALNGFDVETFNDVALLHVLIIGEGHAAFLADLHFLHFILEALEGGEFAFVDH